MNRRIRHLLGLVCLAIVPWGPARQTLAQQTTTQPAAPNFLIFEAAIKGSADGELRWPVAVATASTVEIAVADAHGARLVIFGGSGTDWTVKHVVALPATPLAIAHDGSRYVVAMRRALVAIESPGFSQRTLPLPEGALSGVIAASAGGGLWVHDVARGRILALDADGQVDREIEISGQLTALAATAGGDGFHAVFGDRAEVRRHGPRGQLLTTWKVPAAAPVPAWPAGLVAEPGGGLVVVDRHAGRLVALDATGRLVGVGGGSGWDPGQLRFPAAITRLANGRLAVVDQGNGRVQIFRRVEQGPSP